MTDNARLDTETLIAQLRDTVGRNTITPAALAALLAKVLDAPYADLTPQIDAAARSGLRAVVFHGFTTRTPEVMHTATEPGLLVWNDTAKRFFHQASEEEDAPLSPDWLGEAEQVDLPSHKPLEGVLYCLIPGVDGTYAEPRIYTRDGTTLAPLTADTSKLRQTLAALAADTAGEIATLTAADTALARRIDDETARREEWTETLRADYTELCADNVYGFTRRLEEHAASPAHPMVKGIFSTYDHSVYEHNLQLAEALASEPFSCVGVVGYTPGTATPSAYGFYIPDTKRILAISSEVDVRNHCIGPNLVVYLLADSGALTTEQTIQLNLILSHGTTLSTLQGQISDLSRNEMLLSRMSQMLNRYKVVVESGISEYIPVRLKQSNKLAIAVGFFYASSSRQDYEVNGPGLPHYVAEQFSGLQHVLAMTLPRNAGSDSSMAMFRGNSRVETIDLSALDFKGQSIDHTTDFAGCCSLRKVTLGPTCCNSRPTTIYGMFQGCSALEEMDCSAWDLSCLDPWNALRYVFQDCTSLRHVDFCVAKPWLVDYINANSLFENCTALESVDFGGSELGTLPVKTLNSAFKNCRSLRRLDLTRFRIPSTDAIPSLCWGDAALEEVDMRGMGTIKTFGYHIFDGCTSLRAIHFDTLDFKDDTTTTAVCIFNGCSALEDIDGTLVGLAYSQDLSACVSLTRESALRILSATTTAGTGHTLTFAPAVYDMLTADDLALATSKGWTVARAPE